jgi:hypothetical protein
LSLQEPQSSATCDRFIVPQLRRNIYPLRDFNSHIAEVFLRLQIKSFPIPVPLCPQEAMRM